MKMIFHIREKEIKRFDDECKISKILIIVGKNKIRF